MVVVNYFMPVVIYFMPVYKLNYGFCKNANARFIRTRAFGNETSVLYIEITDA